MKKARLELSYADGEGTVLIATVPDRQDITEIRLSGVDILKKTKDAVTVPVISMKRLHRLARLPKRQTPLSSGFDLYALDVVQSWELDKPYDTETKSWYIWPGQAALVRTGLAVEMPADMEAQVRPRSGLALKHGITVLNSPGTVDADYTGDVGVILINHGKTAFPIARGDRIAQIVFTPVLREVAITEVDELAPTERGAGGYGSTGTTTPEGGVA